MNAAYAFVQFPAIKHAYLRIQNKGYYQFLSISAFCP